MNGVLLTRIARLMLLGSLVLLVPVIANLPHEAFGVSSHAPIVIDGNGAFTSDNGVVSGSGTSDDPYVISDLTVIAERDSANAIKIMNTDAYFTITNVVVACPNCANGIVLSSISNGLVQDTQISVRRVGIRVDKSDSFYVLDSHISAGEVGISVDNSESFQIADSHIGGGYVGTSLDYSSSFQITGNDVTSQRLISLNTDTSFDISNNVLHTGVTLIMGSNLSDATILGNTGNAEAGIRLSHLSGILIAQNNIANTHDPVDLDSCGNITIDNNTMTPSSYGVLLYNCDNVSITDNKIRTSSYASSADGIVLVQSTNVLVSANTIDHSVNGVFLEFGATSNSVADNTITNNQCGIRTDSTTVNQNDIHDNTFAGNSQDECNP